VISLLGICYAEIMVLELQRNQDLEQLLERSKTDPILIFKHSTQCPISSGAYDEFVQVADSAHGVACGIVLVVEHREVSNLIASRLGVRHESPQAIVVKDGRPAWVASHWSITADSISEALRTHAQPAR
jgi:bacillithiol system protein YtxJ